MSKGTGAASSGAKAPAPRPAGLELVRLRTLVERPTEAWLPLMPGDRPVVAPGDRIEAGATIAERLRERKVIEAADPTDLRPGDRWTGTPISTAARPNAETEGELLYASDGRWRIASGEHFEPLESPVAGLVREVRPGMGIRVATDDAGLAGSFALGGVTRGRLDVATGPDGELLPRAFDVGSAGAILVVGARIDAESLTRARAMGVRGIVVSTLPSKERRDFLASEARQRAALHRLPPLAVLILHGTVRRPIASPVMDLLRRLSGRTVAIVGQPPRLIFDPAGLDIPTEPRGRVHVRAGEWAGSSGEWAGLAGVRRFAGGTHLEAGFIRFDGTETVAIPLADIERFA